MVYYKFGRCTVCQFRLRPENVYTLKNCNHTFHHECVASWISEGSQNCPRCREPATLTDIKQLFVEEAGDSSDDSGDELTQSSSKISTQTKANDFFHKKSSDLAIVKLTDSMSCKYANFVKIKNKWTEIFNKCCKNKCINTAKPNGSCVKGNGYGNIIDDENIKYFVRLEGKGDGNTTFKIYAESSFNKPQNCFDYTVYYFEIKCKFEGEAKNCTYWMHIGLKNLNSKCSVNYFVNLDTIYSPNKHQVLNLSTTFNNNDIFGCGLVYPPANKLEKKEEKKRRLFRPQFFYSIINYSTPIFLKNCF